MPASHVSEIPSKSTLCGLYQLYWCVCVHVCVQMCVCMCFSYCSNVQYCTDTQEHDKHDKKCDVFEFKEECNFTWGLALTDPVSH